MAAVLPGRTPRDGGSLSFSPLRGRQRCEDCWKPWPTLFKCTTGVKLSGRWTTGCGADAAPFFRVFNPVSQAEKFDPQGDYIRRWIPELRALPQPWPFKPWEAPSSLRTQQPAEHYPAPLVDLRFARERALQHYQRMRQKN